MSDAHPSGTGLRDGTPQDPLPARTAPTAGAPTGDLAAAGWTEGRPR
ncbi:hypothetical protein [Streptomyces abyssomicinicus]|nr:hypothetical protein [Streptomyces abyssomicinicus]